MKQWTTPDIEELNINETASGFSNLYSEGDFNPSNNFVEAIAYAVFS